MSADLAAGLLLTGLIVYAVFGGADFGAGFWDLTAGGPERGARIRGMVKRSMGPVWEANHVWLIFVLVVFWTAFPNAFGPTMETLYVPLFLAAVGIIFRGAAFALRGEAATVSEARGLGATFALSSVLTPFALGAAVGGLAAGEVTLDPAGGEPWASWLNPTGILAGTLAVATGAYLAAVFLAADSSRAGYDDLVAAFRRRALIAGVVAGGLAIGGLAVVAADAKELHDGLTSGAGLAMVIASALFGAVSLALVWSGRFTLARGASAGAVAAILIGMTAAIAPDFLPGEMTFAAAAAEEATLKAVLISVAAGLVLLIPSLILLFRLTLTDRLTGPLHPVGDPAADHPEASP